MTSVMTVASEVSGWDITYSYILHIMLFIYIIILDNIRMIVSILYYIVIFATSSYYSPIVPIQIRILIDA